MHPTQIARAPNTVDDGRIYRWRSPAVSASRMRGRGRRIRGSIDVGLDDCTWNGEKVPHGAKYVSNVIIMSTHAVVNGRIDANFSRHEHAGLTLGTPTVTVA